MITLNNETVTDNAGIKHFVQLVQDVSKNGYDQETVIRKAYIDGHLFDWTTERDDRIYRRAKLAANGEIRSHISTLVHLQ